MRFVWDEPKRLKNIEVHGLDFLEARDEFGWVDALIEPSYAGKNAPRFIAIGSLGDELVTLVFAPLGSEAVSFISLRPASRKERRRYDRNKTAGSSPQR